MLPRVLASLLALLGAAAMALGVASATVWRPSDTLAATASVDGYLVTEPGVLDLAADEVTLTATGSGPVVIALAPTAEVDAWLGQDSSWRVTGLTSRTELTVEQRPGDQAGPGASTSAPTSVAPTDAAPSATDAAPSATEGAPAPSGTPSATTEPAEPGADPGALADPRGSDLWVEQVVGTGTVTFTWERQDGRWSVLVAAPEGGDVSLAMVWPQVVRTPWLRPGLVVGGVLLGLGVLWWMLILVRARRPWVGMGLAGWLGHWRDVLAPAGPLTTRPQEAESLGRHAVTGEQQVVPALTHDGAASATHGAGTPATGAPAGSGAGPVDAAAGAATVEPVAATGQQPLTRRALRELREREDRERAEALEAERLARRATGSLPAQAPVAEPVHVAEPAEPATSAEQVEPADAAAPAEPAESAAPAEPVEPVGPAEPASADGESQDTDPQRWMSWRPDGWRVRSTRDRHRADEREPDHADDAAGASGDVSVGPGPGAVPPSADPADVEPTPADHVPAAPAARPVVATPASPLSRIFGRRRGTSEPVEAAEAVVPPPEPPAPVEPPVAGPSADAWRRAWGLPGGDQPAGSRTGVAESREEER